MALEVLEAIKQAEQRGEALVREAQQNARDMIEQAERSCRERERQGEMDSRARHRELLEQRRQQVEQAIREDAEALDAKRQGQLTACREKLPQAAALIVKRMTADGHR